MKIVRLDSETFPVIDIERNYLKKMGFDNIVEIEGKVPQDIIDVCKDAEVVIVVSNYLGENVIKEFNNCKAIIRRGTGCDKIDLKYATEKEIIVANLPKFGENEVSEHAILLLLALARKLPQMQKAMIDRNWINVRNQDILTRVSGKILGLVGFGLIGKAVAFRAKAFGLNILDYHRNIDPEVEKQYGVISVTLERLLKESDFIILTCPLNKESKGMIGEKELKMMKPTALLINVARGAVCDEYALAQALKDKTIAGAAIDVYEHLNVFAMPETQPECFYKDLDNVIITPHCAANSAENTIEGIDNSMKQLRMIIQNTFPTSCANPEVYEKVKDRYIKV